MTWLFIAVALAAAAAAVWRAWRVGRDVARIKRDLYYAESRLKRVAGEIDEAVAPLRMHVARLAAGLPVSPELIRAGRRYIDIAAEDARRWIEQPANGGLLILDVRTPKEFAARRIPGARLVPFEELDRRYEAEVPQESEKILVYCAGGERSRMACDFLSAKGYANLYNMQDGLGGWRGPVEGEGEVRFIQMERRR
jgi:rhodanese-related sulfurtransferase